MLTVLAVGFGLAGQDGQDVVADPDFRSAAPRFQKSERLLD